MDYSNAISTTFSSLATFTGVAIVSSSVYVASKAAYKKITENRKRKRDDRANKNIAELKELKKQQQK